MPSDRTERLGQLLLEKIGSMIVSGKIKDHRVDSFLSVTHVKVSSDLSYADVFISSYKADEGVATGVEGLQSASGFIQFQLASVLHIRKTPKLRFHADTGIKEGFDLIKKIESLVPPENVHVNVE
ncbi:MAG: 30S ribosome-binding factor RbfA [Termitinemataceae bacterium]|nr:MAG: 30S ribosome-binding factor RbfA [Termitinemataceae bacterium]